MPVAFPSQVVCGSRFQRCLRRGAPARSVAGQDGSGADQLHSRCGQAGASIFHTSKSTGTASEAPDSGPGAHALDGIRRPDYGCKRCGSSGWRRSGRSSDSGNSGRNKAAHDSLKYDVSCRMSKNAGNPRARQRLVRTAAALLVLIAGFYQLCHYRCKLHIPARRAGLLPSGRNLSLFHDTEPEVEL